MKTRIEWVTDSWQPWTGCTPISEGCRHCYAKRMAEGLLRGKHGYHEKNPFRVTFHKDKLDQSHHWRDPRDIFVCSMGDLFHKDIPTERINQIYAIIKECPQHRFFILTKRSVRMKLIFDYPIHEDFPENLWLGVSVENQQRADERLEDLLDTICPNRFISVEPILEEIYIDPAVYNSLEWVIVGDESGPGRRPAKLNWVRLIRDQCAVADVPFFFKQWHGPDGKKISMPKLDGVVHDARPRRG